jgi:hypothetical protein
MKIINQQKRLKLYIYFMINVLNKATVIQMMKIISILIKIKKNDTRKYPFIRYFPVYKQIRDYNNDD